MIPNTDAPNADTPDSADNYDYYAPNPADNDAAYTKYIYLFLYNYNCNGKIAPNTKKYQ